MLIPNHIYLYLALTPLLYLFAGCCHHIERYGHFQEVYRRGVIYVWEHVECIDTLDIAVASLGQEVCQQLLVVSTLQQVCVCDGLGG